MGIDGLGGSAAGGSGNGIGGGTGSGSADTAAAAETATGLDTDLDKALNTARTGSPVEQGNALRTLDAMTGSRQASDAAVDQNAAPATMTAAQTCTIEVRFKPVIGPTNHAFIVTTDADSANYFRGGPQANNTGLNSPSSRSSSDAPQAPYDPEFGIYGPIVTEYGAYRPGTVDWTTEPSGRQTVAETQGNCDRIETELAHHMDDIEAARINYMPLAANSNSTVREALERSGYPDVSPVVWAPAWNSQLPDLPGPR
ncbi:hypothetical protein [Novosphingobium beihaiensis]|uniref:Uncharacterized protein n=1 Tax=Novosphingobium beihaiensis TaxID=2930389 RepID=A0ABT0BWD8_9SPHN|nr:hypothetical protein [Novosphingobium beihaiensis]MCJ2188969.1 hypothetical protein [Novosphingobium beihaiensis]